MKLSKRFNNSVACVVSLRELAESKEIDIPDVQRGLVWNPTQIANLWKSIFAGYPIGSLTLYKQGENWQLIDGQQRWHAIKLGLLKPDIKVAMATLWVNADNLELMVCTRRHPWGFKWNQDESKLEKLPHDEMMKLWGKMMKLWGEMMKLRGEMLPQGDNPFVIPDMEASSAYWKKERWIPLYRILARERDKSVPEQVWKNTEVWRKRVSAASLPLIRFSLAVQDADTGKGRIHELFTRINKGGTEISAEDYTYSTLCSYLGAKYKADINNLARDFLPPSRVARIYARLAYAAVKPEMLKEPDTPAFWQKHKYDDNDRFIEAIGKAWELLKAAEIPASIYLSATSDEWLTVMCWCMWKFPKQTGSATDKKLLCMLPYVVCRGPEFHTAFCRKFHEVFREGDKPGGILHMVAIGTAYAACYSQKTGMYPLNKPEKVELKAEYPYNEEWLHIFANPRNEALLHFLQTPYMNRMLQEKCGFYPHEKATWGEAMNRPWDVDHIVPQSRWWLLAQEEMLYRESLANMQMLYYRRNREKRDSFIGVPADDGVCPACDFCYPGAVLIDNKYYGWDGKNVYNKRPERLHPRTLKFHYENYLTALNGYEEVVNRRLAEMVRRLWKELGIAQLVDTINKIPKMEQVPDCLKLAVECWRYLEPLLDTENLKWCAIRHDESRQQEIAVKDFYHSLCGWLAVGKEENGAFRCFCWQQVDARTLKIEAGYRRLPDMTQAEWLKGAEKEGSRSSWWVEDGSFKDGIYVSGEGGSSLKEEVEKVRPEDLFEIDHDMKVVYP